MAVFSVYVDDSGTSQDQPVAIAAALIVPAIQLVRMEEAWRTFKDRYGFDYLHATEIATQKRKGQYGSWDDDKVKKVLGRACQITKTFGTSAYVVAVEKKEFDSVVPREWKQHGGVNHYTWAFRTLLHQLIGWAKGSNIPPFEFVFDNAVGRDRDEIEMLMSQFEHDYPGSFEGHYSFRCKALVPALQCVDMVAWSSFVMARHVTLGSTYHPIAKGIMEDFGAYQNETWLKYMIHDLGQLKKIIEIEERDGTAIQKRQEWGAEYAEMQKLNRTKRPSRAKCPC